MSELGPNPLRVRTRLPFETGAARSAAPGAGVFYALLAIGGAGLAAYMALIDRHPVTSLYVLAPAFGALWFCLRAFMSLRRGIGAFNARR